ncbi:hypothetical protein AK830_g12076 [Neonectria ditissima]|uniref:Uncharacterized protein n=1 Tax=Neonectria ditissima TaxID=78410 RepID=A0A0P7B405_9HYPO|nr:hypothetical protein AK830_g12076 [Neonectria ditissima]
MPLSMFIASRSSRHRVAAIALYRALIKSSRDIVLPKDLQPSGPVHPIVHLIRKRVGKNKTYTSLRLVYAAMAAGYKFLTMFTKAQDSSTAEYAMIVNHLRKRANEAALSRSKLPPQKPRRSWKRTPPLLTRISHPDAPPKYISTVRPRPKSEFNGDRKVPVFGATAEGLPYLRVQKPQPRLMSMTIHKKQKVFVGKGRKLEEIDEVHMPAAEQEDNWERLVRKELKAAGMQEEAAYDGPLGDYQRSQVLSRMWHTNRMTKTWKDWVARGSALHQIAEEERILAEKETRIAQGLQGGAANAQSDQNELDSITAKILEKRRDMVAAQAPAQTPTPVADPFTAPAWRTVVRRSEERMLGQKDSQGSNRQKRPETNGGRGQVRSDDRSGGGDRNPRKSRGDGQRDASKMNSFEAIMRENAR